MGLMTTRLDVDDRHTYEAAPQFVPIDALARGIERAGRDVGLELTTEIEEVKAEGVLRQAIAVKGNAAGAGTMKIFVVQSNMGNVHFFATYWKGLRTAKENMMQMVFDHGGLVGGVIGGIQQRNKENKFARAMDFLEIMTSSVIPSAFAYAVSGDFDPEPQPQYQPPQQQYQPPQQPQQYQQPQQQRQYQQQPQPQPQPQYQQQPQPQYQQQPQPQPQYQQPQPQAQPQPQQPRQQPQPQPQPQYQQQAQPQRQRKQKTHRPPVLSQLVMLTREEAATGCTKVIELDDGRTVTAVIPAGVRTNSSVDIPGEGALDPATGRRGILHLSIFAD